ncbi:MAG: hypothetical protein KC519_16530 [Anaerolineae bacterium]|nr:hypothetical protein [Anaerolineae bacterium]
MSDHKQKSKTTQRVQFGVLFVVSTLAVGAIIYLTIDLSFRPTLAEVDPFNIAVDGVGKLVLWVGDALISPVIGFLLATIIWHIFGVLKRERKMVPKRKRKDKLF